ncbi:unnamed protein product [Ambrosiozyma monospora]|uniref:Unnamed protein product n=1 Tax=Ambrosiozyma monospora TaxID=43982 RepID=A0A9W6YTH0_AMBMO|nr:unnamed protein product [Ambrosiozyma monospora]
MANSANPAPQLDPKWQLVALANFIQLVGNVGGTVANAQLPAENMQRSAQVHHKPLLHQTGKTPSSQHHLSLKGSVNSTFII